MEKVFDKGQATVLSEVIPDAYSDLVKTSDFNELKRIVKELAEAQKTTEKRIDSLTVKVEELAVSVTTLSYNVKILTEDVRILAKGLDETRGEVGGLSKTMSYAFENEVYRMLPGILKKKYGITIKEKIIRAEISGKVVNIFDKAHQNGKDVFVVGVAKLRLDERRTKKQEGLDVFEELEDKVKAVIKEYGNVEIVSVLGLRWMGLSSPFITIL